MPPDLLDCDVVDIPNHPGLLYARRLAAKRWETYLRLGQVGHSRDGLVTEIIELVRAVGGNFKERVGYGSWSIMPESRARTMILGMFLLEEDVPGCISTHPGQVNARRLVAEKAGLYFKSDKSPDHTGYSKSQILDEIIKSVENSGGKFKEIADDGAWITVSIEIARQRLWAMFAAWKRKRSPKRGGSRGRKKQPPVAQENPPQETPQEIVQDPPAPAYAAKQLCATKGSPYQQEASYMHGNDSSSAHNGDGFSTYLRLAAVFDTTEGLSDLRSIDTVDLQSLASSIPSWNDRMVNKDATNETLTGLFSGHLLDTDSSDDALDAMKHSVQTIVSAKRATALPPKHVSSPRRGHEQDKDHNMGQSPLSSIGFPDRDVSMTFVSGKSQSQSSSNDSDAALLTDPAVIGFSEKCIRRAAGIYSSKSDVRDSSATGTNRMQLGISSDLSDYRSYNSGYASEVVKTDIVTSISFEPSVSAFADGVEASLPSLEGTSVPLHHLPDISIYTCVGRQERPEGPATRVVHRPASSICHEMARNGHDITRQVCCLKQLLVLAISSQGASVCHEGCIQQVIYSMQSHPSHEAIHDLGCSILEALVCHDPPRILEGLFWNHNSPILTEIQRVGGIERILLSMKAHPQDLSIQRKGCHAIAALAFYDEGRTNDIAAANGVQILVNCLRTHREVAEIVNGSCAALARVGYNSFINQSKVLGEGGISAVLDAMTLHREDPAVQRSCCYALALLASNEHILTQAEIIDRDGVRSVLAAVMMHPNDATLLKSCCDVLINLAMKNVGNQDHIGEMGGIKVLLKGIKDHCGQSAQQWCFEALACAASESILNQERLAAGEGPSLVLQGMQRHIEDSDVQYWGFEVLALVSTKNEFYEDARTTTEAIDAIVNAMIKHRSVAEVQNAACKALTGFEHSLPSNRRVIVEKGGYRALKAAVKTHPKDSDAKSINALLASLSIEQHGKSSTRRQK